MTFILELDNFQGPFDLLLQLLKEQQLDITDVSLEKVTQDFLDHTANLELSIDEMNSFLMVAAKLVMNKSKALIKIGPDEEESEDSLKETLLKYQAIKAKAALLADLSRKPFLSRRNYARAFNWPTAISSYELNETYNTIVDNIKNKKSTRQIKTPKHKLDRAKAEFISHISKLKSFSVNEVLNNSRSKSEAVVYFVAILDLLKKGNLIINEDYIKVGAIA